MLLRKPTTGIGCCARAASGHAAAPPEQRDERAPFHGFPSSGRQPHLTTSSRVNAAVCNTAKLIVECPSRVRFGLSGRVHGTSGSPPISRHWPLSSAQPVSARTGCKQSQHGGAYLITSSAMASPLFDDLVGTGEQRRRDFQAEGLGGVEVDDELEFGGRLDRQIAGLFSAQDSVDITVRVA